MGVLLWDHSLPGIASKTVRSNSRSRLKAGRPQSRGSESVTTPVVTFDAFDAFKVELTLADGGSDKVTVWIAKDTRKPLKMSADLA
jgi:hypothetical protein